MEYKHLRVSQLKQLCTKYDLSSDGRKEDLLRRIYDFELKKNNETSFNRPSKESFNAEDKMTMSNTLFLQLKASNLSYYFNSGVIYPLALEESAIYKNENRIQDIFTLFQEYIVLSRTVINTLEEEDALVEIITTNLPIVNIKDTPLFYSEEPIPLSRIKSIFFKSEAAKSTFCSSAKAFPDSFIQDQLCSLISPNIETEKVDFKKIELLPNLHLTEWKIILRKYDKIMGMFSFMKNAGIFFAENENNYQEYTTNYFSALSIINSTVKPQVTKDIGLYRYILFPFDIDVSNVQRVLFRQILDTIHNDIDFNLELAQKIIQEAIASHLASAEEEKELNTIAQYFHKLEQQQTTYKDLLLIDVIRKNYPIIALLFLARFSNKSRQHTDKQAVRNTFILHEAQLSKSVSEYLLGILGLYYGYKTMIKQDTNLKISDRSFSDYSEKQQSIKFRLESTLDRFTIESIFNFCKLNQTISDEYSFLNIISPKNIQPLNSSKWSEFDYLDNSYTILNTNVTVIERRNKSAKFIEIIDRAYPENIPAKSFLLHLIISNYGIDKKSFLDLVRANIAKINPDELLQLIELDQHQKNNR